MDNKRVKPIKSESFFNYWLTCPNCGASWGGGHRDRCSACEIEFEIEEE